MLFMFTAIVFTIYWFMNNLYYEFKFLVKPFSCESCFGVWVTLAFYYIPDQYLWLILACFSTGIIVPIFLKLLPKILK